MVLRSCSAEVLQLEGKDARGRRQKAKSQVEVKVKAEERQVLQLGGN
jgi:hypothetical protein